MVYVSPMWHKALYGGWPSRDREDSRDPIRTRSRFLTAGKNRQVATLKDKGLSLSCHKKELEPLSVLLLDSRARSSGCSWSLSPIPRLCPTTAAPSQCAGSKVGLQPLVLVI